MAVSASLVKELRERTGAPMIDCKKALDKVDGDIDAAIRALRESGVTKADKKAGRTAADGAVFIAVSPDRKKALLLEINCETDFVARDENFVSFGQGVSEQALAAGISDVAELSKLTFQSGSDETIEQARQSLVSKIGENIQIRRIAFVPLQGSLGTYIHGGRIGVIVDLGSDDVELAKDIAMHVAANAPQVISSEDVSADLITKEREIFTAQAEQSGKPADIIAKMVDGRIAKFVNEVSLLGQPYVKDPNVTVGALLKSKGVEVSRFVRFEVGEGIEKEETNFAEEVMAQVKG